MEAVWRRAGTYVVCRDEDDRVLLVRCVLPGHEYDGARTLRGGGMEWGESVAETARREFHEETGLDVELGSVVGVISLWYAAAQSARCEDGHMLGIVFGATTTSGELRPERDGTTDEARWFTPAELASLRRAPWIDEALASGP